MAWLAPLMNIDQWIIDLSPLTHFAPVPAESINLQPIMVTSVVTITFFAASLVFWRQRDLQTK